MGSKNSAPPPPDYSGIASASEASATQAYNLGEDQLAWAKDQYGQDKALTQQVVNSAISTQNQNDANAQKAQARYEQVYQPVEDQYVKTAQNYDSPQQEALDMGRAASNVNTQFDQQRSAALQNLEGYGVDPSSTRYAALDIGTRAAGAAAAAAAANQASVGDKAQAATLQADAINVGRGLPSEVAGDYGTALSAGNQAVNSTLATTASGANTMGTYAGDTALGNQALSIWGNTLTQGYNAQLGQFNANQQASSGIGSLLGSAAGLAATTGWAEGGPVLNTGSDRQTPGGSVPVSASPSRGAVRDDVDAKLTAGEFVIPADVRSWMGEKALQKQIQKAREERMQGSPAQGKPVLNAGRGPTTFASRPGMAIPLRRAA